MKKIITISALVCFAFASLFAMPVDSIQSPESSIAVQAPEKLAKPLGIVRPKATNNWSKIKDLFL